MRSVYENALPVLKDANVPSHLYLTTGSVGGKINWHKQPAGAPDFDMMTRQQLEACPGAGMRIKSHTVSRPNLRKLEPNQIEDECETTKPVIEKQFGRRPEHFAEPYGLSDARVANIAGQKHRTCVTTTLLPLRPKSK